MLLWRAQARAVVLVQARALVILLLRVQARAVGTPLLRVHADCPNLKAFLVLLFLYEKNVKSILIRLETSKAFADSQIYSQINSKIYSQIYSQI